MKTTCTFCSKQRFVCMEKHVALEERTLHVQNSTLLQGDRTLCAQDSTLLQRDRTLCIGQHIAARVQNMNGPVIVT